MHPVGLLSSHHHGAKPVQWTEDGGKVEAFDRVPVRASVETFRHTTKSEKDSNSPSKSRKIRA